MSWREMEKCPVCGAERMKTGMANHIFGRGKAELYEWYFNQREDTPHTDYLAENMIVRKVKRITLKQG